MQVEQAFKLIYATFRGQVVVKKGSFNLDIPSEVSKLFTKLLEVSKDWNITDNSSAYHDILNKKLVFFTDYKDVCINVIFTKELVKISLATYPRLLSIDWIVNNEKDLIFLDLLPYMYKLLLIHYNNNIPHTTIRKILTKIKAKIRKNLPLQEISKFLEQELLLLNYN